jgi:hypothetical protein
VKILEVKNTTWSQLVLSLAEGKSLTLPARGSADIREDDFNSPECQRLFAARTIIVLSERETQGSDAAA